MDVDAEGDAVTTGSVAAYLVTLWREVENDMDIVKNWDIFHLVLCLDKDGSSFRRVGIARSPNPWAITTPKDTGDFEKIIII